MFPIETNPRKPQPGDTIGAIDCGSNAIRFSTYTIADDSRLPHPTRHRYPVRLGSGTFADGNLAESDMDAAVEALQKIARISQEHQVIALPAVATSAIREAANCQEFLARVHRETGIIMKAITGDEEARLVALGVCAAHSLESDALIIDIGGGSTEIIHCDRTGEILRAESIPLGAVRLAQQAGMPEVYTEEISDDLHVEVFTALSEAIERFDLPDELTFIGVGGTASSLVKAARFRDLTNSESISVESLDTLLLQLQGKPVSEYHAFADISEDRSTIIYAGAVILLTVMLQTDCEILDLSDAGLREGLLIDYLNRIK